MNTCAVTICGLHQFIIITRCNQVQNTAQLCSLLQAIIIIIVVCPLANESVVKNRFKNTQK